MFIVKSLLFYPEFEKKDELSDEIIIPSYQLHKMIKQYNDNDILYVTMTNTENNESYLVTIGSPHTYDKNTIFAPQWILDIIGCDTVKIKKANIDIPVATKIIIKPLDPIVFQLDTLACFEKAFMNLHSIREGITLPINLPELGYTIFAYIEKVEPAGISRIVEGEVIVEFINEFSNELSNELSNEPANEVVNEVANEVVNEPIEMTSEERRKQVRESWMKRYSTIHHN